MAPASPSILFGALQDKEIENVAPLPAGSRQPLFPRAGEQFTIILSRCFSRVHRRTVRAGATPNLRFTTRRHPSGPRIGDGTGSVRFDVPDRRSSGLFRRTGSRVRLERLAWIQRAPINQLPHPLIRRRPDTPLTGTPVPGGPGSIRASGARKTRTFRIRPKALSS